MKFNPQFLSLTPRKPFSAILKDASHYQRGKLSFSEMINAFEVLMYYIRRFISSNFQALHRYSACMQSSITSEKKKRLFYRFFRVNTNCKEHVQVFQNLLKIPYIVPGYRYVSLVLLTKSYGRNIYTDSGIYVILKDHLYAIINTTLY